MSTLTILFTDVVASTRLRNTAGDVPAHEALAAHEAVLRDAIARHAGREIKTIGDGFMVVFGAAGDAVVCAVAMQRAADQLRRTRPGADVHVRIGIHTGDAIDTGDDVFGAAVDAATRIMARARGEEILISQMVRGVIGESAAFSVTERGRFALKGFEARWRLYRVDWREQQPAVVRRDLTVVVTDLKGSTANADRLGDDAAFSLLRAHNAVINAQASIHGAVVAKSIGDGFILAFESAAGAAACAVGIQRAFAEMRREHAERQLHVLVAIHAGSFIVEAGELYGRDLFIAFRLLQHAQPDQVLVTDEARSQLGGRLTFTDPEPYALTGIEKPQSACRLDWTGSPRETREAMKAIRPASLSFAPAAAGAAHLTAQPGHKRLTGTRR
jgi:class 3 adenylate cyclase